MSQLREYFDNNTNGNCITKWHHYFEIYEFWFSKYRNNPVVILEIGVFQGGSLKMWNEYFGENCKIYGIDINPECKKFESENIKIFIGSQSDKDFLNHVKSQIPKVDILIDDGGHMMDQQIISFETLYEHVKPNGYYLCEDIHTSYWKVFHGGYKRTGSFIEYSKGLIDKLNAWHIENSTSISVDEFTKSTFALHFYDSILVIEKKPIDPPISEMKGKIVLPIDSFREAHKILSKTKHSNSLLVRIKRKIMFIYSSLVKSLKN
jgi:hypothetical protein